METSLAARWCFLIEAAVGVQLCPGSICEGEGRRGEVGVPVEGRGLGCLRDKQLLVERTGFISRERTVPALPPPQPTGLEP